MMSEKLEGLLILSSIGLGIVVIYLSAWKGKSKAARTGGSFALRVIAGIAAMIATSFFALGLADFRTPGIPVWQTLAGEMVALTLAIGLATVALRKTKSPGLKQKSSVTRNADS